MGSLMAAAGIAPPWPSLAPAIILRCSRMRAFFVGIFGGSPRSRATQSSIAPIEARPRRAAPLRALLLRRDADSAIHRAHAALGEPRLAPAEPCQQQPQ